ncbi:CcdC family protein [Shouchella shacheensis]|uniref:CcdC family protein n=1 Tax=Shouchella shacheensis TaxID=1649580 RepID=UPI0009EB154A|nr:cytochrome c biogenesis protein CcdC [Shouchella shacheensis]
METNGLLLAATTVLAVLMGGLALFIRMKAAKKPTSAKKIILPPLFMSTGFLMFLYEPVRPSLFHVLEALVVGALFSLVLIYTSRFEIRNGFIYLKRSKAFAFILIALLFIRIILRMVLGQSVNPEELSGMFFLLAYGMLVPWRGAMLMQYLKLKRRQELDGTLSRSSAEPAPLK